MIFIRRESKLPAWNNVTTIDGIFYFMLDTIYWLFFHYTDTYNVL